MRGFESIKKFFQGEQPPPPTLEELEQQLFAEERSKGSNPSKKKERRSFPEMEHSAEWRVAFEREKERMKDPTYLPTRQAVMDAFVHPEMHPLEHHDYVFKEAKIFEFFTQEYIDELADRIVADNLREGKPDGRPLKILEIGAGNGKLSTFLREAFAKKLPDGVEIIATDSGEWGLADDGSVQEMDHQTAMSTHQPDVVISSWMPNNVDLTADIRACPSVGSYVLIGQSDICGDSAATWGEEVQAQEGFARMEDTDSLSDLQLCRTDWRADESDSVYRHSETAIYTREQPTT